MKSLKIKNILLCAFAATTLFSSCSDYLDKLPENKVDEEKVDPQIRNYAPNMIQKRK